MEIFLLFLIASFVLGLAKPQADLKLMLVVVVGMAFLVSVGYFVFRLV